MSRTMIDRSIVDTTRPSLDRQPQLPNPQRQQWNLCKKNRIWIRRSLAHEADRDVSESRVALVHCLP